MNVAASWNFYTFDGLRGIVPALSAKLFSPKLESTVQARGIGWPVHLRLRSSDPLLYREIIRGHSYDLLIREPKVIVDAGANIGLASIWFANRYPAARIIAIEPEPDNFRMLAKNTAHYSNIVALQAALWSENTMLTMIDRWGSAAGYEVENKPGTVQAFTLSDVMRRFNLARIDLLKVDIEGAEKEVFEASAAWIDSVGTIAIELHDRFKPGCAKAVFAATSAFEQKCDQGELTILERV